MRKTYILLILCTLAIAIVLLLAACSKTGPKGATGPAGPHGSAGLQGTTGTAGAPGSQILSGTTTPTSTTGNPGDYYFDNLTDSLYGPKTSTGWGTAVSLRGNAGATGATGPAGATGQTGAQGPPGTANVIYYNWTGFNVSNWSVLDPTYFRREYPISMPAITSQILDQGVVLEYLEYLSVSNGDITEQLIDQVPVIFYNVFGPTGPQKENFIAEISPGVMNFYLSDAMDNNDPGELYIGALPTKPIVTMAYLYRIILIPGGVLGTGINPHQLTYKEVCTKYGIQP
jgi:hypothetical protein